MREEGGDITALLSRVSSGDKSAEEPLLECVYLELHRIAESCMRGERRNHTLQPTALVNEAYQRLARPGAWNWENRLHFYTLAARTMRRILKDYARQRLSAKRGGGIVMVDIDVDLVPGIGNESRVLLFDQLLERLALTNERAARVVEMRFYVGMTDDEIAEVLGITRRTVQRDWLFARAWLHKQLDEEQPA
jgi:RNA polymerase sigma factor (TIGR02999 family)